MTTTSNFTWTVPGDTVETSADLDWWCNELADTVDSQFSGLVADTCREIGRNSVSMRGEQAHKLFSFLMEHPCAHPIKESWPEAVSDRYRGMGFKIGPAGKKSHHAPDDRLYLDNPVLQQYLPRGLVFGVSRQPPTKVVLALFANRKFFGRRRGDDDDSDVISPSLQADGGEGGSGASTASTTTTAPFDSFVETEKANGEACQISVLVSADDDDDDDDSRSAPPLWIIGSKNRKVAVHSAEEVAEYDDHPAYAYAVEMARCFFATLPDAAGQRAPLAAFLRCTGLTLNFEFESPQHQHLVPLHTERLVMIGGSGVHVGAAAAHPVFGFAMARRFGFASVLDRAAASGQLAVRPRAEIEAACTVIGSGWETEGSVLVLLTPGTRRVHDLIKVKSFWYVCLRAIREKLARLQGAAGVRRCCSLIRARLRALRHSLAIPEDVAARFADLGCWFAGWLVKDPSRLVGLRERYPSLWVEFLRAHNLPLDQSLVGLGAGAAGAALSVDQLRARMPADLLASNQSAPLLLLMQGLPGCGKSVLAAALADALNARSVSAVQVSQDDFVAAGHKKASSACLSHVRQLLETGAHRVIILARNNANLQQSAKYVNLDRNEGLAKVLFLCPEELCPGSSFARQLALLYLCCCSVVHRRLSGEQHDGTRDLPLDGLSALPVKFWSEFRPQPGALTMRVMSADAWSTVSQNDSDGGGNGSDDGAAAGRLLEQWMPDRQLRSAFAEHAQPKRAADSLPSVAWRDLMQGARLNDAVHCKQVCQAGHRPVDQLVDSCLESVVRASAADLPPYGSFLGVRVDLAAQARLMGGTADDAGFPRDWAAHGDHVTLVHSKSVLHDQGGPEAWRRAAQLTGRPVVVQFQRHVCAAGTCELVVVSLRDEADGKPLDGLVFSGRPHVTLRTAPGTRAHQALDWVSHTSPQHQRTKQFVPFESTGVIELFERAWE